MSHVQIPNKKVALSSTPEYRSWYSMKSRCYKENSTGYNHYGGRGIEVCDRWIEPYPQGFLNFFEDMGTRPKGTSLERVDVNGNYTPDNCIWDTAGNQAFNKRVSSKNFSGIVGVIFIPIAKSRPWKAFLHHNGWDKRLGYFETLFDAACARKSAELKYYPTKTRPIG